MRWLLTTLLGIFATQAEAATPPLSLYGNLPGFEMAALSPSGRRVALVGLVEGRRKLIIEDDAGQILSTMNLPDQKFRRLLWAGEKKVLLWVSVTAALSLEFTARQAELYGVSVIPINEGGKPFAVFQTSGKVTGGVRGFEGLAERDGRWYGYFGA